MEHSPRINTPRILFGLMLFTVVVIGPYWLFGLLALLGYVLFPLYWEMLFAGAFFDLLYYAPMPITHGIPVSATMIAIILLAIMVFLGERLRLPGRKQ